MGTSSKNYHLVFERLKKLALSDEQVITILEQTLKSAKVTLTEIEDTQHQKILHQLLWLLFVRGISIDKKFLLFIPMYFNMIRTGSKNLSDLKNHLILAENTYYGADFEIDDFTIEQLKTQIEEVLTDSKKVLDK
ncbi:MAG: hypothetical protein ACFB0B_20335 [Thermonemataceae bacterium]